MRTLYYMGLEPYKGRYTLQLQDWNEKTFKARGINYVVVPGETMSDDQVIVTGQVLDAHGRSYFSMSQMMNLVKLMKAGKVTSHDVILFEDMFTPGIESLPYIMKQIPAELRPKVFVRCLAQTIDPDDFVHVWGMTPFMTAYEFMVDSFVDGILATNEEMVANIKVAGWSAPIYNISGLAFDSAEVQSRVGNSIRPFLSRKNRVVFAGRWDQEKQPDFFMDLVEYVHANWHAYNEVEFCVCSGGSLRSNRSELLTRARSMEAAGLLSIYENLDKNEYYEILNDSRVSMNTALQDWQSNCVNEADALGCNVLFPAYRSFPEAFANDHTRLYVPWSIEDAAAKLAPLLNNPHPNQGKISAWADGTVGRILDIVTGTGEDLRRDSVDYRKHARISKY